MNADSNREVVGVFFGVFGENIKVALVGKNTGVDLLKFTLLTVAALVFAQQLRIRKSSLGVFVKGFHVRVGGGVVEVKIAFFNVFAVVAFVAGEADKSFFENRVLVVPKREGEAKSLVIVRDTKDSILAPTIGAGPRVIVGEIGPSLALVVVVLPNGAPLPLTQVGTPSAPMRNLCGRLLKAFLITHQRSTLASFSCSGGGEAFDTH